MICAFVNCFKCRNKLEKGDILNHSIYPLNGNFFCVHTSIPKPHMIKLLGQALKDTFEMRPNFFKSLFQLLSLTSQSRNAHYQNQMMVIHKRARYEK